MHTPRERYGARVALQMSGGAARAFPIGIHPQQPRVRSLSPGEPVDDLAVGPHMSQLASKAASTRQYPCVREPELLPRRPLDVLVGGNLHGPASQSTAELEHHQDAARGPSPVEGLS